MKRKIASLLSLTMILSSFVGIDTFAEGTTPIIGDINGTAGTSKVEAINTTVYRVIVPSTPSLSYIADPQGLAQLSSNAEGVITDLASGKGNVYSEGDVTIANRSSKDVKVTATVVAGSVTAAADETEVKIVDDFTTSSPTNPELKLYLVATETTEFSVEAATGGSGYNDAKLNAAETVKYKVITSTESTDNNKTGYQLKADTDNKMKVTVPVALKHADYVAKAPASESGDYTYNVVEDSVGGAVTFSIAGKCSTADLWDKKPVSPALTVTYSFADATSAEMDSKTVNFINTTDGSGLQTHPVKLVDITGATISKTDKKVSFKLFADADDNAAVKTNWETKDATVQSLTIAGTSRTNATIAVADDGTISVSHDDLANAADNAEVVAKVLYDGKIYTAKVTVPETPADVAPTFADVTATAGTDCDITASSLGTGTLKLKTITELTVKAGGTDVALVANNLATVSNDGETITIVAAAIQYIDSGSTATLAYKNAADESKTATFKITKS